jgi:hypothetical protein
MKIKDGFILRNIAGEWVVVPTGERALRMQGAMILNEVASFIWRQLQSSILYEAVLDAIVRDYDIARDDAKRDLDIFLRHLLEIDALDDENNEDKDA